jgi:hypothetical protein
VHGRDSRAHAFRRLQGVSHARGSVVSWLCAPYELHQGRHHLFGAIPADRHHQLTKVDVLASSKVQEIVRVGGAADESKQGGVVRVRQLLLAHAKRATERESQ